MRIKSTIKEVGYFWLPSKPERQLPGTLSIYDGGKIELEVIGLFDESIEGLNRLQETYNLGRIVGCLENNDSITLEDCFYKKTKIAFGGLSKAEIYVQTAFIGYAYKQDESIYLNSFKFSVEGLDEWIGISGIGVFYQFEEKTASIRYTPPPEKVFTLNNGMTLLIIFNSTFPGFPNFKEAKITQKAYFKLLSEDDRSLDEFISTSYKIVNFLGLALDTTVCIENVLVKSKSLIQDIGNGKSRLIPISVYYPSLPYTEKEPIIKLHNMIFNFRDIEANAQATFNNWMNMYKTFGESLDLYFNTQSGATKVLQTHFLFLAQAIETYHRRIFTNKTVMDQQVFENLIQKLISNCPQDRQKWLSEKLQYANEVNLRSRIKDFFQPFNQYLGNGKEMKNLIDKIVNTRNYLTHYDKSLELKAATGGELFAITQKMELIFQCHLLQQLGFCFDTIHQICNSNFVLRQKVSRKI